LAPVTSAVDPEIFIFGRIVTDDGHRPNVIDRVRGATLRTKRAIGDQRGIATAIGISKVALLARAACTAAAAQDVGDR
jgi:hypothetical protein